MSYAGFLENLGIPFSTKFPMDFSPKKISENMICNTLW
jgi:hypothetical protein